jgi:SAM-dependent methyltransferase
MSDIRGPLAKQFANQVLATVGVDPGRESTLAVLDVGSGYGDTAMALADRCGHVTALEPAVELHDAATRLAEETGRHNMTFVHGGVEDLDETAKYDMVVLDNVYEHLPNQPLALERVARSLNDNGSLYLLVPNKLWPIEAHYGLPGLAWLPLPAANVYLRVTRRGRDYSDAMFAPTYWSLKRQLREQGDFDFRFTLPTDRTATVAGTPLHYRIGMGLIERFPALWAISKALLVVAVRRPRT